MKKIGRRELMTRELLEKLEKCPLFAEVDFRLLEKLSRPGVCTRLLFHTGAMAAFRGDEYLNLWVLVRGKLSAEFRDYNGRVLKVENIQAPESVASAVLFSPDRQLPVNLLALEDTEICSIPRRHVLEMMQKDQAFLLNYLKDSGLRLTVLAEKLRLLHFSTIREKIASYLLDLADKQSTDSPILSISRETLSEIFGVSRPSLSREFSHMAGEGFFLQEGRQVHLLDRRGLEDILNSIREFH
jgi:CRP-like cAMP-binding protein